jgi:hypothetical protein
MHLPDVEAAIERLELLEPDHPLAGSLHAEVENLGQRYFEAGSLESSGVEAFQKATASLISIYKQHISIEDDLVFTLAARLLSSADKAAIADEWPADEPTSGKSYSPRGTIRNGNGTTRFSWGSILVGQKLGASRSGLLHQKAHLRV